MKLFAEAINNPDDVDICARLVLEAIPVVMRTIRAVVRQRRPLGLSLPQFRALNYLLYHRGASLTDVAEHLGLCASTASKQVESLVQLRFVMREEAAEDRRRSILTLTDEGMVSLESARQIVQASLVDLFTAMTAEERAAVSQAMQILLATLTAPYVSAT